MVKALKGYSNPIRSIAVGVRYQFPGCNDGFWTTSTAAGD